MPAIPIGQAIGRVGCWFNQELFGAPTDLPWGLEIDPVRRPAEYANEDTFHPAFLYEAIWNVALAGVLVWLDRRGALKRGQILPLWITGYGVGRFLVEAVRVDPASLIWGVRVNHWTSGAAVVFGLLWFGWTSRRSGHDDQAGPRQTATVAPEAAVLAGSTSTPV